MNREQAEKIKAAVENREYVIFEDPHGIQKFLVTSVDFDDDQPDWVFFNDDEIDMALADIDLSDFYLVESKEEQPW